MKINYLKAFLAKTAFAAVLWSAHCNAQTNYVVESIPYQEYEASNPFPNTPDDKHSEVFEIPFDFTFFGQSHNELIVCGNGFISFNTDLANTFAPWQFDQQIPNVDFPVKNAILGCFHDMNNTVSGTQGSLTWSVLGEAPYRQFVLMFSDMPQYFCNLDATSTFQIILHETYNYIDVQVTKKDLCSDWNGGNAVIGIVDPTGTIAYAPEGRNTGAWQVSTGEGWRFKTADLAALPNDVFKNGISLYPNPSSDILNIENVSGKEISGITVYSVNGAVVKQTTNSSQILVSNLQSGIYIVKVEIDNQTLNYRFIKK